MRGFVVSRGPKRNWRTWTTIIVSLVLVLGAAWYFLENPKNQTFGNTITGVFVHQKVVALTFDDGPNPPYTDQIVDYLHAAHVPATFFVVGRAVEQYPDVVRKEVRYGNALGNHSWDHAHMVLERDLEQVAAHTARLAREVHRPVEGPVSAVQHRDLANLQDGVRVQIDEAGGHEHARRVDFDIGAARIRFADVHDDAAVHHHDSISDERVAGPVEPDHIAPSNDGFHVPPVFDATTMSVRVQPSGSPRRLPGVDQCDR